MKIRAFLQVILLTATFLLITTSFKLTTKAVVVNMQDGDTKVTLESEGVKPSAGQDNLSSERYIATQIEKDANGNIKEIKVKHEISGFIVSMLDTFNSWFMPQAHPILDESGNPITTSDGSLLIYQEPGTIDSIVSINKYFYQNPPASGIVYAQEQYNQIVNGHKAQAAEEQVNSENTWIYYPGLGFNLLKPIQNYWILSRNISYIAMIIIIIIVSFLVMFKANLQGQTQVTIANSIPNIVIALLMITISYPLSGFAIDLITIGSNALQQILVQNEFSPGYKDIWSQKEMNIFYAGEMDSFSLETLERMSFKLSDPKLHLQPDDPRMSVWEAWGSARIQLLKPSEGESFSSVIPDVGLIGGMLKNVVKSVESVGALKDVLGYVVGFIFIITALTISFKLFFKLVIKYLILIILPIISPFIMLTIALPGQGIKNIMAYFKTLLASSLSFISVYAVFLFMIVLTHDTQFTHEIKFTPPLLGYTQGAQQGESTFVVGDLLKMILAFGLFLSTPIIPDMLDQYLNVIPEWFGSGRLPAKERYVANTRMSIGSGTKHATNIITNLPVIGPQAKEFGKYAGEIKKRI